MFKKKYRISGRLIFDKKSAFQTPLFTLRVTDNGLSYNRYGFVVSTKVDKRAVVRNSIRRKTRSCLENMKDVIKNGYDMLFFVKREAVNNKTSLVCSTMKSLFRKEGLLQ